MFTGIIQSIGLLKSINKKNSIYTIKTNLNLNNCNIGSSISCDGVCLTIINIKKYLKEYIFDVNVSEETLKRSNLLNWTKNTIINLEKSLRIGDEIAGHFVYGHVDTILKIKKIKKIKNSWEFQFPLVSINNDKSFKKMIVEKGSITINGISLTVANIVKNSFNVSIIPHTFKNTNLCTLKEKNSVNIEFDFLAKYISKHYEK